MLDRQKIAFIDLRQTIKDLRDQFQWFGLRQTDLSRKCSCVLEMKSGTTNPDTYCTRCMNTGYMFTDYVVKGYAWHTVLGVEFKTNVGPISTQTRSILVEFDRPVNKFDLILFLDLDPNTGMPRQPFRIMQTFTVSDTTGLIGDDGKLSYWKCILEERTFDSRRPGEEGTQYNMKVL